MAEEGPLARFVRDALASGARRDAVREALVEAGWRADEVEAALDAWVDVPGLPPVPRPRASVSARAAFLYGLTFFALFVVVVVAIRILFDAVDVLTGASPFFRPRDVSWDIAALLVFAPLFVALDRRTRGGARNEPSRKRFAYVALFFSALAILLTLVTVISLALSGGLAPEVIGKAVSVAGVAAVVLALYRSDFGSGEGR